MQPISKKVLVQGSVHDDVHEIIIVVVWAGFRTYQLATSWLAQTHARVAVALTAWRQPDRY